LGVLGNGKSRAARRKTQSQHVFSEQSKQGLIKAPIKYRHVVYMTSGERLISP
jgi:hypothetical protein